MAYPKVSTKHTVAMDLLDGRQCIVEFGPDEDGRLHVIASMDGVKRINLILGKKSLAAFRDVFDLIDDEVM